MKTYGRVESDWGYGPVRVGLKQWKEFQQDSSHLVLVYHLEM